MNLSEDRYKDIYRVLGDSTESFLSLVDKKIAKYTVVWQLSDISLMNTYTVNMLFSCDSRLYGPCVLKICIPGIEVASEINCLLFYDGHKYCKLWAYSFEDDVLLLEKVMPGEQMWDIDDYAKRARLIGESIKNLPVPYNGSFTFPTYGSWMRGINRKLIDIGGMEEILIHLTKAIEIYTELKKRYRYECLLHGDLHQENMLLNSKGDYTIIDPKGVIDDPVMETARFLMNEVKNRDEAEVERISTMVEILSNILSIPVKDILRSMYIDAALGQSWCMENHYETKETYEEAKTNACDICGFVYGLLMDKDI